MISFVLIFISFDSEYVSFLTGKINQKINRGQFYY